MDNYPINSNPGLMLALDVEDFGTADQILSQNSAFIDTVKLGSVILSSPGAGPNIISHIKKTYSIPIVVDSKLKDIPHVLLSTAKSYAQQGASAITCWADVGRETLEMLIDKLNGIVDVIVLTALTSLPLKAQRDVAKDNIQVAVDAGCKILQIPGNFPELITWARSNIPADIRIVSCGVGAQGGIIGNAIRCGATHEIIGRKLLDHENDQKMTECFMKTYKTIHKALKLYPLAFQT